jgi:hypothetical protein
MQLPAEQTWLPVQLKPQVPQLWGSVKRFTQVPRQLARPDRQTHELVTHCWELAQAWPQALQLFPSEARFAHNEPQAANPGRHGPAKLAHGLLLVNPAPAFERICP